MSFPKSDGKIGKRKAYSRIAVPAIIAAAALALAACSSSTPAAPETSSAAPETSSAAPETSSAAPSTDTFAAALAAAQKVVADNSVQPTTLTIPQLNTKPAPGGTIDVIACGVPSCQEFAHIVEVGVAPLGWKVKLLDAGGSVKTLTAAYDQAIRDKPSAVIGTGGWDPTLVTKQLAALKALKIPVVMQYAGVDGTIDGITAFVFGKSAAISNGHVLGSIILADAGGKDAHVAYVGTKEVSMLYKYARAGIKDILDAPGACNSCTNFDFDMTLAQLGTATPGLFVSYLRSHPEINYVVGDFADVIDGFPQALKQAGLDGKVKLMAAGVGAVQAQYLKDGEMFAATYDPNIEIMLMDTTILFATLQGADALIGDNYQAVDFPSWIITPKNVELPPANGYLPMVKDYQALFNAAWKM